MLMDCGTTFFKQWKRQNESLKVGRIQALQHGVVTYTRDIFKGCDIQRWSRENAGEEVVKSKGGMF